MFDNTVVDISLFYTYLKLSHSDKTLNDPCNLYLENQQDCVCTYIDKFEE